MKKIIVILILTIAVISCAHKTIPPATEPATNVDAGRQTFTAKCGRCHNLKNPADYTSDEWVSLVNSMALKAQLDDTEKANVLAYVQANSKH